MSRCQAHNTFRCPDLQTQCQLVHCQAEPTCSSGAVLGVGRPWSTHQPVVHPSVHRHQRLTSQTASDKCDGRRRQHAHSRRQWAGQRDYPPGCRTGRRLSGGGTGRLGRFGQHRTRADEHVLWQVSLPTANPHQSLPPLLHHSPRAGARHTVLGSGPTRVATIQTSSSISGQARLGI